jgi:predicted acyl esterase
VYVSTRVDVYPGWKKARKENFPFFTEELPTPRKVADLRIEIFDLAHRFAPDHRLRLEIAGSAVPFYTPNPNTGNNIATDTEWKVARQTIYHDRARASSIPLPVMSRE